MSSGAERKRRWRAANPEKYVAGYKAYNRARYDVTREENLARSETYATAHREELNTYHRGWAAANPKRIAAYDRARRLKNPAEGRARRARRRARVAEAVCKCCKRKDFVALYALAGWLKLEVDHIRPLSKRGQHCVSNLQLLTKTENRRKGAKWAA